MPDTPEGKVTLAVIQSDIRHLTGIVEALSDKMQSCHEDHEQRLRSLETRVTRIEQKQGVLATGQAAFTTAAAVVAGWFGSRQ